MAVYTQRPSASSRLSGALTPGISTGYATGISTKADPTGALIVSSYGLAQPVRTPRRFDKLADEGYTQNPIVYRAINLIAVACAGIPWLLYQRTRTSKHGQSIEQHPLLDLMNAPNSDQGWGSFFEQFVSYLLVAGNSYIWANRPGKNGTAGAPAELWNMRPDRMRVVPDEKMFVGGYTYEVNGNRLDFAKPTVLHTKTFAPLDDWYGMSPLVVAARAIDTRNAGGDWNLALLQNSGRVPGFFVAAERLGDTQYERMRNDLIERYTGTRNVGIPGLLEEGVGWVEAGKTPRDMDWSTLSREQSRDIAITLGVPPELLGDASVKTYSNFQEARASLYEETVLPLMDRLRDELNRWLVPMFDTSLRLDYDREDIEALQEERGKLYQFVAKATFLTINEQRDILGYPERPEGDVIVVPLNTATLDEVMEGDAVRRVLPSQPVTPQPGAPLPNDGSDTDEGAPTPAPNAAAAGTADARADAPGGHGIPDGGIASATDGGMKGTRQSPRQSPHQPVYDPLDDLLAGKVIHFDPKAGSRSRRVERQRA